MLSNGHWGMDGPQTNGLNWSVEMASSATVCVIIAARNAESTIARAVASALREKRVSEVVVVDDGSQDATGQAALEVNDPTGRLHLLRLDRNQGPAHARNRAIEHSKAPLISILDADDFFLEGRFETLLDGDDWDFVADNIVFIDSRSAHHTEPQVPNFEPAPRFLDLQGFVEGNISKRGASRGEIGFLKPVMRRSFLDAHGLRYDEQLRLGEDYDLYARALLKAARYKIVHGCGYGAVVRADSLSGKHRTEDLKRLYEADLAMLAGPLPEAARNVLSRHERHVRGRYELRHFLDIKASRGLIRAGVHALMHPTALPAIAGGVLGDKLEALGRRQGPTTDQPAPLRYLLPAHIGIQK